MAAERLVSAESGHAQVDPDCGTPAVNTRTPDYSISPHQKSRTAALTNRRDGPGWVSGNANAESGQLRTMSSGPRIVTRSDGVGPTGW